MFAIANLFRINGLNKTHPVSIDFRTIYLSANLLSKSQNPYNDSLIKSEWNKISKDQIIVAPGKPGIPSLYPPNAFVMFLPLAQMDFYSAQNLYFLLNIFLILLIPFLLKKLGEFYNFNTPWIFWFLIIASLKYTLPALWVGQTVFLCTALFLSSWYFSLKDNHKLAGFLLGLAAFKFTLVLHLGLLFIIRKKWKTLIYGISTVAVLGLSSLLLFPLKPMFSEYLETMSFTRHFIFDASRSGYPYTHEMLTITESGTFLRFIWSGLSSYMGVIYLVLMFSASLFAYRVNKVKPLSDVHLLALLGVLNLMTVYHLYYDTLILLPMVWLLVELKTKFKWFMLLPFASFFIPFRSISELGDGSFNWLAFDNSVGCLLVFILLIYLLNDWKHKTT